jgi:hypothetical protein
MLKELLKILYAIRDAILGETNVSENNESQKTQYLFLNNCLGVITENGLITDINEIKDYISENYNENGQYVYLAYDKVPEGIVPKRIKYNPNNNQNELIFDYFADSAWGFGEFRYKGKTYYEYVRLYA